MPNIDLFKNKQNGKVNSNDDQNSDVQMKEEKDAEEDLIYPGKIIPFNPQDIEQKEILDEGEIDEAPTTTNENQDQDVNGRFIKINKDKGNTVLLTVTNLSNETIRVFQISKGNKKNYVFI